MSNAQRPIQMTCAFRFGVVRFRHGDELPFVGLGSRSG